MTLASLTPILIVGDVARTVEYYRDVLGFEFTLGVVDGSEDALFEYTGQPLGFAMLKRDAVELMLQSGDSVAADLDDYRPGSGDVVALYIDVDDVATLHEEIKGKADLLVDLRDTFYGAREFHVRDCNGVIVGFAQRLRQP